MPSWFHVARLGSIGLEIGVATAIGWWLGRKLAPDSPAIAAALLLLGVVAGFVGAYRTIEEVMHAEQTVVGDDGGRGGNDGD